MKTRLLILDPLVLTSSGSLRRPPTRPDTPLEALMSAAPFEEPEESVLEHELKVEGLRDAMDVCLTDREQWVIDSIFYRRRGIRLLAAELNLSKTHIARIRDSAFLKLGAHMTENGTAP